MTNFLKMLVFITTLLLSSYSAAQTGISNSVSTACDPLVTNFMTTHNIPGLSIALAKDGKLVYSRGFGNADLANTELTQPHHLFRIASLSKPITSIAIMKMMEDGLLTMTDNVFGPTGILASHPQIAGANITDARINNITVQHLLEHAAGWNRGISCFPNPTSPYPYFFGGCDPIVAPLHVAQELGLPNPISEEGLIIFLLENGLDFTPGTQYQYSNIGYLVLGEIIETLSGMTYEAYVKKKIFEPIGACDTHLGKNLLLDKQEREVEYRGNGFNNLDIYGNGTFVPWEYGGFNLEAMDAHGGWISTARDLVRIILAVDNFNTKPDILSSATINTMTLPSTNNANYAKGWSVNGSNNWWHTGALDGTATIMVRSNSGYTWAVLLNQRVIGATAGNFWSDLDGLPWSCIGAVSSYPSYDLLQSPTIQAKDLVITQVSPDNCSLDWQSGNGTRRIIVAKEGSPVDRFPLDGQSYFANWNFGDGSHLGNGNYVVYNGTGTTASVFELDYTSNYYFRIFEYNQNSSTGNLQLYNLSKSKSHVYDPDWFCPDELSISSKPLPNEVYYANQVIYSSAQLNAGQDVKHYAGECIIVHQEFEVSQGAEFLADIATCDEFFGRSCVYARPIATTGVYYANGPDAAAGAQQAGATHSNWFVFTPPVSKRYTISSCDEGVNTRLHLYAGSCSNLMATADNNCESAPGMNLASTLFDISLTAGINYYIEWDDRWSDQAFHFEIE